MIAKLILEGTVQVVYKAIAEDISKVVTAKVFREYPEKAPKELRKELSKKCPHHFAKSFPIDFTKKSNQFLKNPKRFSILLQHKYQM